MEQMDTVLLPDKSAKKKRCPLSEFWLLTWMNPDWSLIPTLFTAIDKIAQCYCGQEEVCPTTGTPHMHVKIAFKKKVRAPEHFSKISNKINWSRGHTFDGYQYALKPESRKPGGMTWAFNMPLVVKCPEIYGWQVKAWEMIKATEDFIGYPDPRKIFWFWSDLGGIGKTAFYTWMHLTHKAYVIAGKASDMKCALAGIGDHMMPKICVLNIPRACGKISYEGIEEVKDGIFFSGKYESGMKCFVPPHMCVFANREPDFAQLSHDRWIVIHIDDLMIETI